MKKKRSVNLVALLLSMILVLAAVPSIPSVASTTTAGSNTSAKKSVVSVVSNSDTICVGEQCTLKLKNSGNWQLKKVISSNSKVAKVTTVSKSKKFATVKGVQEGKTKITFKLSYKKKVKKVSCNLTVKRLLPLKSAIGVNEAGTLALNVHTWKITKAVSANDEVASVAKVFKTHLKFVGKTAGKTTLKITAKNGNKTKTEKVSIVVKDVTQSTDQPTQQPILPSEPAVDLSVTEVTVGSQEEMQSALKSFPNLVELTIHTDLAETFKLDGNYPNLEVILDAPFAEFYNSATVKEVYIYAISCNTWHEKGLNNIINLFCECHIIVDEKALNTTINVNKNKCNSHIESNSSTVINVLSESVLTLSGSKDLATINIKSSGVIINANVVAKIINLELRTSLVINNTTDDVIQVNTPYGSFSVSKETKRTIMESGSLSSNISFGGGFGSGSSLGGDSSSSGSNSSNSGNGSASGSDGEQTKPNPEPDHPEQPKPDEPVDSECKHEEWTEWSNAGDDGESRECVSCHKKETRQHDLQEKISYEKIEELNESSVQTVKKHKKFFSKQCNTCIYKYSSSIEEECIFEDWQYFEKTGEDTSSCPCGHEETRQHVHSDEPSNLEFEFSKSNEDCTHEMQATYTCEFCQAEVNVTKSEDCEFGETTIKKNPNTQWNFGHLHILSKTCNTCGYIVEEEEACVINEDIPNYYMYVNNHLALVRYCSICENDMYFLHNEHTLGEWFPRNDQEHRRECECTTVREDEDHTFGDCYDNSLGGFQCDKCGYLKVVDPHNHGYGLAGKHGDKNIMMDIVLNKDAYAECVNMSPISNPDPTSGEYCSRFDFKCRTCGAKYSCYIDHDVQNGSCKCGYAPIDVFSLIANSTSPVADEIEADALIPKKEVSVPKEVVTKKPENNVIPETVTGCAITVSGGAIKTAV